MSLKTRPPTGVVPYPVVLLEGEEKAGKSYSAALLSSSDKVGRAYWIDLGEGAADEYGAIPGVRYDVVEHDGTYAQILQAVIDVKAEAQRAKQAGEPPVVLVIDSMSALWEGLKDWATQRAIARAKKKGRSTSEEDVRITTDLWNDAGSRYRRLMTQLLTFPGIVVLTARGKEVVEMANGQPVEGSKVHKVEGHKTLPFDATVWVRMSRTRPPLVIGARSVHVGLVPGKDDPQSIDVEAPNLLEWLIFDAMKVDAGKAAVRDLKDVTGGDLTPEEQAAETGEPQRVSRRPAAVPSADPVVNGSEDPWANVEVKRPPVVTDAKWADDFRSRVAGCDKLPVLRGLFDELTAQVHANAVSPDDAVELRALVEEQAADLTKQAERVAS